MAGSSTTPDPPAEQSYTSMSVGDVDAIGAHCQMPFCRQLDFLPFKCESCKSTFCLDHRTESAHSCPNAGAWAVACRKAQQASSPAASARSSPKPNILTHEQQCSDPSCKTLINTPLVAGVHCPSCNRSYCLKHRMKEDHDCDKLTPLGAKGGVGQSQRERGLAALEKLRAWGAAKQKSLATSATSKSKLAAAAEAASLNDLKRMAKGDAKVPQASRIYVHVEASADTTTSKVPSGRFFYSRDWSIGRVLDAAAKSLQVQNVNNRGGGEEEKLRVFHVEGGRLLEFGEKIGATVSTGNTLVLLRGVGPAVPDLIKP